jgi:hypothetical protein
LIRLPATNVSINSISMQENPGVLVVEPTVEDNDTDVTEVVPVLIPVESV